MHKSELEDIDLEALLSGEHKAFEQLVRVESPRLFRVIMRIVRDEDEARNVMQETFLQAYQRRSTFRRESKLTTWLYAIGINLARAALRKKSRLTTLDEEEIDRLQPVFRKGTPTERYKTWNPEKLAEKKERKRLVHEAIDRLPVDYKMIVTLRDIEQMSTEETARILDISPGAARVRLHRARQALRTLLDEHFK